MKIRQYADAELAAEIHAAIKEAQGHCPCVLEIFRNEDTKCMCKEFREAPIGAICTCGMYIKTDN